MEGESSELFGEPIEDDLRPLNPVDRRSAAGELMALPWESVEIDVLVEQPERYPQLFRLADWATPVLFAVDDEHGSTDVLYQPDRVNVRRSRPDRRDD